MVFSYYGFVSLCQFSTSLHQTVEIAERLQFQWEFFEVGFFLGFVLKSSSSYFQFFFQCLACLLEGSHSSVFIRSSFLFGHKRKSVTPLPQPQ